MACYCRIIRSLRRNHAVTVKPSVPLSKHPFYRADTPLAELSKPAARSMNRAANAENCGGVDACTVDVHPDENSVDWRQLTELYAIR